MTLTDIQENAQQIAKTIGEQLTGAKNPMNRLSAMIGAKDFVALGTGLAFKYPRGKYVKITLNSKDLYDVEFSTIRGMKQTIKQTYNDVYAEDLKKTFEEYTKLYLSL